MFDIGFWELIVLGLVALVVVGPERLPKLAYTAGKWLGKGRSMMSAVKSEIDKEIKAEELKQILEEQKKQLNPLEEVIEETSGAMRNLKSETESVMGEAQKQHYIGDESGEQTGDSTQTPPSQANDRTERSV